VYELFMSLVLWFVVVLGQKLLLWRLIGRALLRSWCRLAQ
jgi:hypothetical protein